VVETHDYTIKAPTEVDDCVLNNSDFIPATYPQLMLPTSFFNSNFTSFFSLKYFIRSLFKVTIQPPLFTDRAPYFSQHPFSTAINFFSFFSLKYLIKSFCKVAIQLKPLQLISLESYISPSLFSTAFHFIFLNLIVHKILL